MSWTPEQMIDFLRRCQQAEAYCRELGVPFTWPGAVTIAQLAGWTHHGSAQHQLRQLEAAGRIRCVEKGTRWRAARWEVLGDGD